jgi:ABC-type nitrate/sulfonate/bicarbonate transport system substrate-binding protein
MMRNSNFVRRLIVLALLFVASHVAAQPAPRRLQTLQVISFDGGWNLPVWAAQRQGFFEANGLSIQLTYTPNSAALVTGMFDGK